MIINSLFGSLMLSACVSNPLFSSDDDAGTSFADGALDFASDDTIDVHVQVAPATTAAGTLTVWGYFT